MKMKQLFEHAENHLKQMSDNELADVLAKHDEWFVDDTDEDLVEIRRNVNEENSEDVIEYIINTDPILVEGGLFDFLKTETGFNEEN